MKPKLFTVQVTPVLPKPLLPLEHLAYNLYWDWTPEIAELFARVDPVLWKETGNNPVALLGQVDQKRLEALSSDIGFLAHLGRATEMLDRYLNEPRWFQLEHLDHQAVRIGYFSAEFGLASCLPIYSGGLGILAGDHLKSASDLGIPLVGIGLLYQEGYFRQYLNSDGWQMESYPPNDFYNMPMRLARKDDGTPVRISVEFPGRLVHAQVWRIDVGRVPLFLLDTNVPENNDVDRAITRALYSGGVELRIQQLMMLGIGGYRALVEMDLEPTVCHMNEGHAGFLGVERARHMMGARHIDYELARDLCEDGNLFTTHTPVPAGFDVFQRDLVERHMSAYIHSVGMSVQDFMALGRRDRHNDSEPLNMAVVAIRHATLRNGVSELHGKVSRDLVQSGGAWEGWPTEEVPIDHVTNGIHTRTWIAPEMAMLLDRYLGPHWRREPANPRIWEAVDRIPSEELWRTHVALRHRLVSYVREHLVWQGRRRAAPERELDEARHALDPEALTIGFARRFATYKRATLLFSDPDRLRRIITNTERPVQFIFAGKAHPADHPAKEFIKLIASKLKDPTFGGAIVFLEDYEISVAAPMISGVDVWLNTPQRPKEASGTSGMKVVPNGGLNLSILDGWWAEGYDPELGWAIGAGENYDGTTDAVEANALYDLLETQVVPLYYDRDQRSVPQKWVSMMRASMKKLAARFSSDRMVMEYATRFYIPTASRFLSNLERDPAASEQIVHWKNRVRGEWRHVAVDHVEAPQDAQARLGESFVVSARVRLGGLAPDDVDVQLYHGLLDARDELRDCQSLSMQHVESSDGVHAYRTDAQFAASGRYGYTVRIVPRRDDVLIPNELTVIRWA
ncbi:MAG: alpha-glucan family phosphorylase [Deltaproteobacteria bacterium]